MSFDLSRPSSGLPAPLDSESETLLRVFLGPILESAASWKELDGQLTRKGYGLAFRDGRLVILDESGQPLCTGQTLGAPLRSLAQRLGRPCIRADRSGRFGQLA